MEYSITGKRLVVKLPDRIDTTTAPKIEQEMQQLVDEYPDQILEADADSLQYISGAGLRILMKNGRMLLFPSPCIRSLSPEQYAQDGRENDHQDRRRNCIFNLLVRKMHRP